MLRVTAFCGAAALSAAAISSVGWAAENDRQTRPNVLLAISDNQTWMHAAAYGDKCVETPAFDRVAREGVLFNYAYCTVPSCGPSRLSIRTGLPLWRLGGVGCSPEGRLTKTKTLSFLDLLEDRW